MKRRDAAPVDLKLIGRKQASACLLTGCLVCQSTSEQLVYPLSRAMGQSDGVTVFKGNKRLYLHVPGTVMSLTKLF